MSGFTGGIRAKKIGGVTATVTNTKDVQLKNNGVEYPTTLKHGELIQLLSSMPLEEDFFQIIQKNRAERELFEQEAGEKLKPVGFDHAPDQAKLYREKLIDAKDIDQMEQLHKNLIYNEDGTVNLPDIDETFCVDITGKYLSVDHNKGTEFADEKGYHLLSMKERELLRGVFGEYANKGGLFHMLGFKKDSWYRTSTEEENDNTMAYYRRVNETTINGHFMPKNNNLLLCGFKNKN